MKNIISVLIIVFCFAANATSQSLWNEGLDGSFDNWEEVNEVLLPKGWYGNTYSGLYTYLTPTTDRHGNENKACKISTNFTAAVDHWYTWHLAAATSSSNVLNIPKDTEFYYTFWAKAEVEGLKMYIGAPQMYDKNHGGNGTDRWNDMPYVELTTEWKQYGVLQKSNFDCTSFSIQLRGNKVFYVDDIVLEVGDELPPLNQEEPEPDPEPTSLWNEDMEGNFDTWEEVNGIQVPKGWYGTTYNDVKVNVEAVADRNGEEGKACKINCSANITWHTWHWALRTVSQAVHGTVNVLNIPENTDFYYTFWAKASEENTRIYIGVEECYNPKWEDMPYVDLTTEWKQYGILQPACDKVGKTFAVHLRQGTQNKDIYIDDIVLNRGKKLPLVMNGVATILVEELELFEENSLAEIRKITLIGDVTGAQLEILQKAMGDNNIVVSIEIEGEITEANKNYFENVNPNCLIYIPANEASETWKNVVRKTDEKPFTAITTITITDGYPFDCPVAVEGEATYTRNCYNDGNWETIILPFSVSQFDEFDNYIIEKFVEQKENVIHFEEINTLTDWNANQAYIIKSRTVSAEAVHTFSNPNATIQTAPQVSGFVGVYEEIKGIGKYILNEEGSQFGKGGEVATVPAFRAYYLPENPDNAPARFNVDHSNLTNISTNSTNESRIFCKEGVVYIQSTLAELISIYSIDGQRIGSIHVKEGINTLEGLNKGIYLINNQKVIVY